ncbi:MAG: helix-turn-helix transcriptional regulator [Clostridia bacterium]|nr:helix-turn-helix transcriptional regulator [Clostridia bacterium]
MFNTQKFGRNLARLRHTADMTQTELADRLNLTRQAVSRYELGESFPDVSILVLIADIFAVTLDELIGAGEPTRGESRILRDVAMGNCDTAADSASDLIGLAPYLKPSVLRVLAEKLSPHGIDLSDLLSLAEYLSDESVITLLSRADPDTVDEELLARLMPLLDERSKMTVFQKILDGEMDWHMIAALLPYAEYLNSQIEAAVVEGVLPWEVLDLLRRTRMAIRERKRREV